MIDSDKIKPYRMLRNAGRDFHGKPDRYGVYFCWLHRQFGTKIRYEARRTCRKRTNVKGWSASRRPESGQ